VGADELSQCLRDIRVPTRRELPKTLTGIRGFDEITRGGLPTGRPTLVCGGPGSGKTLLALTFLVNGALQFDEQEPADDLR
jgi:circadian clock protein KaiC